MVDQGEVTRILTDLSGGRSEAMDELLPVIYAELRSIAHRQLRRERAEHTLGTTALVSEAYLKLVDLNRIRWQDRAHFFAVSATAMRRILVDYAVRRKAAKRGGGQPHVQLHEAMAVAEERAEELLAIDEALRRLESCSERYARVVECRFFAGMTIPETAAALGVSPATVKREWQMARAWLNRELGP